MKDKEHTLAEKVVIDQIRKWPTLYHNECDFFHDCIIGMQSDYEWEDGFLVSHEKRFISKDEDGSAIWGEYEITISYDVAASFLNPRGLYLPSVNSVYGSSPIKCMPDNMDKSWIDFISHRLYMDAKLTPDLYEHLVASYCIILYGMKTNPNASMGHYISEWNSYYKQIPSFQARLNCILEIQATGKIPSYTYTGMWI